MHKVQMNSSSFDPESVKKRISHFDEFDNGHVMFSYSKMSVADSEEKAKQASIKHPDDVYYVSYDDLMNSCSDTYWFQGVAYDNKGAWKALREYRKAQAAGLNSGRRPLNSSEEQVKISGIVTIYSDFVDFKRSVSEHLLQTAVGDRAKLKFKWVGDNKVEVKAICSVADECKVKILLENSDVTKTVAWSSSANSNRKESDRAMRKVKMNSSASCDDYVKLSTATLKRKLKTATPEEKKCIQAELNARGVYSKRSVNSAETSSDSYVDVDGVMGSRGDVWTIAELADYWNREQANDPIFSEYATYEDWLDDALAAMRPLNSSRKVNSSRKEGNNSMRKVIFRGKLNSSRKSAQRATSKKLNSSFDFEKLTIDELEDKYCDEWGYEPGELTDIVKHGERTIGGRFLGVSDDCFVFEDDGKPVRYETIHDRWYPLDSSRKRMNSSRKSAQRGTRRKLNSSVSSISQNLQKISKFSGDYAAINEYGETKDSSAAYGVYSLLNELGYGDDNPPADAIFYYLGSSTTDESPAGRLYQDYDLDNPVIMETAGKFYAQNRWEASEMTRELGQWFYHTEMNSSRRKLNSSLVGTFLQYHDDADNYRHQSMNYDALYDMLNAYAKPGENPEDMDVDKLFERAPETEQRAMIALINPKNWDGASSRNRMNSSRKINSSRRKRLNSSKKSEILELTGWSHDDLADAFDQWIYDGGGEYEEDEQFDRFADAVAQSVERGDTEDYFGIPLKASRRKRLNSSEDNITADDDVQDTGIDGGDTATETAELLDDALIVQNPETKEVSLFVATEDDEVLPESVDVIAEVTPVVEGAVLDSSRRLKRFAASKLNSSKGCLNSDSEDVCPACGNPVSECTCEPGTVAYDEIQLPDDTVVEVENILVVQDDKGELGLFMPEDAEEAVPEGYEVVATATPAAEADVLDSSRRMKKSNAKKLNSSAKRNG